MNVFVHLAGVTAALLLAVPAAGAPPKGPDSPDPQRAERPLTRQLEEIERELEKLAESVRKTAAEVEKEAKSTAEETGKRVEKEAEKRLPEVRRSLGELRKGLESALEEVEQAIQSGERPVAEGTIQKLDGRRLTLAGVRSGPTTFELDEQTLVRRGSAHLSILALGEGQSVRIRYEPSGGRNLARRIEIEQAKPPPK